MDVSVWTRTVMRRCVQDEVN